MREAQVDAAGEYKLEGSICDSADIVLGWKRLYAYDTLRPKVSFGLFVAEFNSAVGKTVASFIDGTYNLQIRY